MNQQTIYIIIGVVVVLLIGVWAINRTGDAPATDTASTTASTTPISATVTIGSDTSPQPSTPVAERPRGDIEDGAYTLNTESSVVGWVGRKPRVLGYEDTGTLKLSGGSFVVTNGHIASGDFVIDMTTLAVDSTGNNKSGDMLVEHLSSDDFFAVETHPTATFAIRNVTNSVVTGSLTVKGITKIISFPATIAQNAEGALTAKANITLNRAQWDIRYGSGSFFENLGDNLIADEVSITLDLVANK
jgi:polyisoprenoid-binding protein YceI